MKTFYIFEVKDVDGAEMDLSLVARREGEVTEARAYLRDSPECQPGKYRVLEDTSGIVTKSVENAPKVKISFESSRKRGPRQPKVTDADPELVAALRDSLKSAKNGKKK